MPLPVVVRKHRGVALFVLLLGGFFVYQQVRPSAAIDDKPKQKDVKVVAASVDKQQTLHSQVDELKGQVTELGKHLSGTTKDLQAIRHEQKETEEALRREQKERAAEKAQAKRQEERLREELEKERQRKAQASQAATQAAKKEVHAPTPAAHPPAVLFELRTIGSSQARPKNAPSPIMHHQNTAYLPAACFARIRFVSGVSATSQLGSSGGATWGHPILYVIREPFDCAHKLDEIGTMIRASQLRKRTRVPLDGCLGLGTGKADLASSRVQIEGTLMSCVMPDGEAYEVPIKAFMLGEDAVQGVVGEIQTHESAKVGKAFIAGMLEEAAAFFSAARRGVTISVSGQSVPYGGMETTLQQIGKYWLEQARALQPTLFFEAGREGYIVMLQGVPLDGMHIVNWLKTGVM